MQRVEPELRVVGAEARRDRDELAPHRTAVGLGPVDDAHEVGRDPHAHRREPEPLFHVCVEGLGSEMTDHFAQLLGAGDGVLRLPLVVEEGGLVDLGVTGHLAPPLAREELPVLQLLRRDGGLDRGRNRGVGKVDDRGDGHGAHIVGEAPKGARIVGCAALSPPPTLRNPAAVRTAPNTVARCVSRRWAADRARPPASAPARAPRGCCLRWNSRSSRRTVQPSARRGPPARRGSLQPTPGSAA